MSAIPKVDSVVNTRQPRLSIALLLEHDHLGVYLVQRGRSWYVPTADAVSSRSWESTTLDLAVSEGFGTAEVNAGQLLSGPLVVEAMTPEHRVFLVAQARTRRVLGSEQRGEPSAGRFFGRNTLLALGDAVDPVSAVMLRRFGWLQ